MAINLTKCAAAPLIIKSCHQRSINSPQSKRNDCEIKASYRSQEFQIHGSGGGDVDEASISEKRKNDGIIKCKGTQTDYRESETQTSPWEAPYKLSLGAYENPEVLSLVNSTWGNGLPAGMHEIEIIKRMRMKRAWMENLPPMDNPSNIKICETITSAIEANEWAFREAEIQFIMDSRLELMERIEKKNSRIKDEKTGRRIEKFAKRLGKQRDKKIREIRGNFSRELRKLDRKHRVSSASASCKIKRYDIIEYYANPSSQLYAPLMRFGYKSEGRHEILDKTLLPENYVDRAIRVDDSSKWLPTDEELQDLKLIPRPEDLCARRTRWTDDKLRKLHADLKAIRLNDTTNEKKDRISLLKRKFKLPALPVTPMRKRSDSGDAYRESSSLFMQKITRGRAVQCMMFEGRDRCRELIEELKSTHSRRDSDETFHENDETNIFVQSHEQSEIFVRENRICEILDSLEGTTVAGMLDMLSKEETRLREERKAHAFSLLAERDRNRREAEESGRRQLERNRRRELDEMFRQMVKVNQDSVQLYLEDIVKDGIDWAAREEARKYVEELAEKIDASTSKSNENESDPQKDEEMIADMVHNFLLPEVDKELMRKKIRERQQGYLRMAHVAIHDEIARIKSMEILRENEGSENLSNENFYNVEDDESESDEDIEIYTAK